LSVTDTLSLRRRRAKHRVQGSFIRVHSGLWIYKTAASPFYVARIRDPKTSRYLSRSTREKFKTEARRVAAEMLTEISGGRKRTPSDATFRHFGIIALKSLTERADRGEIHIGYVKSARTYIETTLMKRFGNEDVRDITTRDFSTFIDDLTKRRPDISPSTLGTITATFRNVMKEARANGLIRDVPATPRPKRNDNPRAFFRFHPLVSEESDAYQRVMGALKRIEDDDAPPIIGRRVRATRELYDIAMFCTHTFVRPISTELFAIRHGDVSVAEDPKRLILTIRRGKTGARVSNSMQGAVSVYQRIRKRHPDAKPDDFLFLPHYQNRVTAARVASAQFSQMLKSIGLERDPYTGAAHTIYSLRHTAICMRIVLSEGKVNIFNLAKNAGTSVEQIERFYAKFLPLSPELARNLQSFSNHRGART